MSDLNLFGASPFDAIRRTDEAGEYWSARDLMPLLGYTNWREFKDAIDRAKITAANTGADVSSLFGDAPKKVTAGRPAEDFRLARYAAYLVAMNGDPRKPEVAAAQSYFAVQTRVAEIAPVVQQPVALPSRRDLALMVVEAEDRIAALEPKAEAFDTYMDADNALAMGAAAQQLGIGRNTMMRKLREAGVLQKDNRPYQRYAHHFKVVAATYEAQNSTKATHTTYVRPSGVELIRKVLSGGKGLVAINGGAA